ncbi:MAG TPA: cysteine-rich small domain-containing protein [Methanothrix sp.]|jgi:Zn-finger protein|uniref:cysteine-rich small domain-containing protein n=1 Tax=Methanothrix sp. TaxID=90426 RepID=UPI002B5B2A88|nr:cysteine-rich small domain-containing protein [Methanothrix sp.]MDI9417380.1 cysteine-rich small domain-containing protein [Euryarchaeota archaeon]HON35167.1 cysteine-rich small domain-containing protein [Methanothrix sp.]HRU76283.1 cysteine-rich small domain-containing protein [Methanothrix sp.]
MALLIAHSTTAAQAAENSLEGIIAAKRCRADFVHMDVRLSCDGKLVLMRDESVDRTTDGKGLVEDLGWMELRAMHAGKGPVPTLTEALSLAEELGLGVVVEMREEGLEALVAEVVPEEKSIIISPYHTSLREIKDISRLKTGIVITSLPIKPVELALWAEADAIFPERVNPRLFKEAHQKRIEVYPGVVNSLSQATWLLRLGADGLLTDDPCLIEEALLQPVQATGRSNCEYYPCHFEGQDCTHCFCPLYPCKDEELGRFVRTKRGKRFWSCIDCKLVHLPNVARYLSLHPESTTEELKALVD